MNHTGPDGSSYLCDQSGHPDYGEWSKTLIYQIMISAGMTVEVSLGYHQA